MEKIFPILVLASMATLPVQAVSTKQPMQYNTEATQKLREKLNSIKYDSEVIAPDFLKIVDQLIVQGADPNIYGGRGVPVYDVTKGFIGTEYKAFLSYLISGSDQIRNPDVVLIEKVTKNALEHGANPNAAVRSGPGSERYGDDTVFVNAVVFGLPSQVRLLIEHGADVFAKNENDQTARTVIEEIIKREKEDLSKLPSDVPQALIAASQKDIARMEEIRDILAAAEQKK